MVKKYCENYGEHGKISGHGDERVVKWRKC